jgi:hypothetical protein
VLRGRHSSLIRDTPTGKSSINFRRMIREKVLCDQDCNVPPAGIRKASQLARMVHFALNAGVFGMRIRSTAKASA